MELIKHEIADEYVHLSGETTAKEMQVTAKIKETPT
jgi:hypothetical protein